MIEFLVPERGRGSTGVRDLPQLGMNAQPLRFMDVALMLTVRLAFDAVPVTVPHPAAFALHKVLVAPRRKTADKREKDLDSAMQVFDLLERKSEMQIARDLLHRFPPAWRKHLLATLREEHHNALAAQLAS